MLARDVMTPQPIAVTPDEPLMRAARIMRDHDVGFLPVVVNHESMRVEGVLTDRDIVTRCVAAGAPADPRVGDCMTAGRIATVTPDADVHRVTTLMEREQVRRIPVVDATGRLVGVIAQADIALRLGPVEPLEVAELGECLSAPAIGTADGVP